MVRWNNIFKKSKILIGMIHTDALPGTPLNNKSVSEIIKKAVKEAELYEKYKIDSLIIENMNDVPYLNKKIGHEVVSTMSVIAHEVKKSVSIPVGIQILAGANKASLSVALAANLDYIRAEGFIFSHIGDEGFFDSDAGNLLRYRKNIGGKNIAIFTDIKKKHSSHSITSDLTIEDFAHSAEFFLSDGIIITGKSTGYPVDTKDLSALSKLKIPIIIGSGLTAENISNYWKLADGFIIGSYFKEEGYWRNQISIERILKFHEKLGLLNSH